MKATEREVDILIQELDPNRIGEIDYNEFLNCCFLSYIFF